MSISPAGVAALIDREVSVLADDKAKQVVLRGLVDPRQITLDWDCGNPG